MKNADSSDQYDQFDPLTSSQQKEETPEESPTETSEEPKHSRVQQKRRMLNADEVGDQDYQSEPSEKRESNRFKSIF